MSAQQVTPELRQWIIAQAQAGHRPETVLESMRASGWNEDVAIGALEEVLKGFLDDHARASGLPAPVPVPEADLRDSPSSVVGGRPGGAHRLLHAQPARHRLRQPAVGRRMR